MVRMPGLVSQSPGPRVDVNGLVETPSMIHIQIGGKGNQMTGK